MLFCLLQSTLLQSRKPAGGGGGGRVPLVSLPSPGAEELDSLAPFSVAFSNDPLVLFSEVLLAGPSGFGPSGLGPSGLGSSSRDPFWDPFWDPF